jgi:hypothetical protein
MMRQKDAQAVDHATARVVDTPSRFRLLRARGTEDLSGGASLKQPLLLESEQSEHNSCLEAGNNSGPNSDSTGASHRSPQNLLDISLVELVLSLPISPCNARKLRCGGIEAVPSLSGETIADKLKSLSFSSLPQLLFPRSQVPAIMGVAGDQRMPMTHSGLARFVEEQATMLRSFGIGVGQKCGLLLPNGPEMASCLVVCISTCVAVPLNIQQTAKETISELKQAQASAVIIQYGEDDKGICAAAGDIGVRVIQLRASQVTQGSFHFEVLSSPTHNIATAETLERGNGPDDVALLLHTSGTSGTRKAVPYTLESLVVGAACIIYSWELRHTVGGMRSFLKVLFCFLACSFWLSVYACICIYVHKEMYTCLYVHSYQSIHTHTHTLTHSHTERVCLYMHSCT